MATEIELRHAEKDCLLQILMAQHRSAAPKEFKDLILWAKTKMEPEDVKLVLKEFDDWKNS
jgi:hypothetical protein